MIGFWKLEPDLIWFLLYVQNLGLSTVEGKEFEIVKETMEHKTEPLLSMNLSRNDGLQWAESKFNLSIKYFGNSIRPSRILNNHRESKTLSSST